MGNFDRETAKGPIVIPERLIRLDREMLDERTKDFDYVYAVRRVYDHEFRIKVCIARIRGSQPGDYEFVATASIAGRVHRQHAYRPSDAFAKVSQSLSWVVSKLVFEKNYQRTPHMATV